MADKVIYWSKTALTGGAAEALDSIDGTALQDGEVAHVWISNVLYIYRLDADSAAAESSPAIIAPDTNAGDKRWILQSYYSGSGTLYTDHIAESTAGHGVEIDGLTIKDSGFALGSDADGDMYYRASSALARLAKGDAKALLGMDDSQVPAYRKLMVSDAGIMTNAYQPAFLVTPASDQTDIAINENVEVVWGTEVFDTGGNFASNTFTAPVTGVYHFDLLLDLEDFDSAMGVLFVYIAVTGRNFRFKMSGNHVAADTDYTSVAFGVTVKLSATNTAKVNVYQAGGTAQLDITTNSYFSGFLIG